MYALDNDDWCFFKAHFNFSPEFLTDKQKRKIRNHAFAIVPVFKRVPDLASACVEACSEEALFEPPRIEPTARSSREIYKSLKLMEAFYILFPDYIEHLKRSPALIDSDGDNWLTYAVRKQKDEASSGEHKAKAAFILGVPFYREHLSRLKDGSGRKVIDLAMELGLNDFCELYFSYKDPSQLTAYEYLLLSDYNPNFYGIPVAELVKTAAFRSRGPRLTEWQTRAVLDHSDSSLLKKLINLFPSDSLLALTKASSVSSYDENWLIYLVRNNCLEKVTLLLESESFRSRFLNDDESVCGTAITAAVDRKFWPIVSKLIHHKAKLTQGNLAVIIEDCRSDSILCEAVDLFLADASNSITLSRTGVEAVINSPILFDKLTAAATYRRVLINNFFLRAILLHRYFSHGVDWLDYFIKYALDKSEKIARVIQSLSEMLAEDERIKRLSSVLPQVIEGRAWSTLRLLLDHGAKLQVKEWLCLFQGEVPSELLLQASKSVLFLRQQEVVLSKDMALKILGQSELFELIVCREKENDLRITIEPDDDSLLQFLIREGRLEQIEQFVTLSGASARIGLFELEWAIDCKSWCVADYFLQNHAELGFELQFSTWLLIMWRQGVPDQIKEQVGGLLASGEFVFTKSHSKELFESFALFKAFIALFPDRPEFADVSPGINDTWLTFLAWKGEHKFINCLLSNHAYCAYLLHKPGEKGLIPLQWAVERKHVKATLALLMKHVASHVFLKKCGAIQNDNRELLQRLINDEGAQLQYSIKDLLLELGVAFSEESLLYFSKITLLDIACEYRAINSAALILSNDALVLTGESEQGVDYLRFYSRLAGFAGQEVLGQLNRRFFNQLSLSHFPSDRLSLLVKHREVIFFDNSRGIAEKIRANPDLIFSSLKKISDALAKGISIPVGFLRVVVVDSAFARIISATSKTTDILLAISRYRLSLSLRTDGAKPLVTLLLHQYLSLRAKSDLLKLLWFDIYRQLDEAEDIKAVCEGALKKHLSRAEKKRLDYQSNPGSASSQFCFALTLCFYSSATMRLRMLFPQALTGWKSASSNTHPADFDNGSVESLALLQLSDFVVSQQAAGGCRVQTIEVLINNAFSRLKLTNGKTYPRVIFAFTGARVNTSLTRKERKLIGSRSKTFAQLYQWVCQLSGGLPKDAYTQLQILVCGLKRGNPSQGGSGEKPFSGASADAAIARFKAYFNRELNEVQREQIADMRTANGETFRDLVINRFYQRARGESDGGERYCLQLTHVVMLDELIDANEMQLASIKPEKSGEHQISKENMLFNVMCFSYALGAFNRFKKRIRANILKEIKVWQKMSHAQESYTACHVILLINEVAVDEELSLKQKKDKSLKLIELTTGSMTLEELINLKQFFLQAANPSSCVFASLSHITKERGRVRWSEYSLKTRTMEGCLLAIHQSVRRAIQKTVRSGRAGQEVLTEFYLSNAGFFNRAEIRTSEVKKQFDSTALMM
jgi:hypothetical protein